MSPPVLGPGDLVPPLVRRLGLADLVAYAGATWDWYRLHYDLEFAAASHLPAPLVDGQMLGALLAEQALDFLGPRSQLRRLMFRFKSPVFAGETVRCEASVSQIEASDEGLLVTLESRVIVEASEPAGPPAAGRDSAGERVAVSPASATLLVRR